MRALLAALAGLLLAGCLVTRSSYDEQVARGDRLGQELEASKLRIAELERRVLDLQRSGENLELERSSLEEERLKVLDELESMRQGNAQLLADLERERQVREEREAEIDELAGTYSNLVEQLEQEVQDGQIEIHSLRGLLQVRAMEGILFDSGSAEIKLEGREVLAKVAAQLREIADHRIRVEGHTDPLPISNDRFASNWELSTARAARVVRLLIEEQLDPAKLSAAGFGPHQPIADNSTREGRARNRRIEIVLVPETGE